MVDGRGWLRVKLSLSLTLPGGAKDQVTCEVTSRLSTNVRPPDPRGGALLAETESWAPGPPWMQL